MEAIIGRNEEKAFLETALRSGDAELIAVLGRRRIGKTFLLRNYLHNYIVFELSGMHNASLKEQLQNFARALKHAMQLNVLPEQPPNWSTAFDMLSDYLTSLKRKKPMVVFLDELPWLHTPKSGFLAAFGHWWNTYASRTSNLKVVICGSAASWMIRHIFNDRGGLHNRVTERIRLKPFTLAETAAFLENNGVQLDQYQLLQLYMALGGIPHYLKQVRKGESVAQTIDRLCFSPNGMLKTEFTDLYQSLFTNASNHEAVVRALSRKGKGMSRAEIISACNFTTGGWTTELFEELEQSGFITQYIPFGRTLRDALYKLTDEYSLFYLKFIENKRATGTGTWLRLAGSAAYKAWCGFAFEAVCQKHAYLIRKALGISGVYTEVSAWRHIPQHSEKGAQIDLVLDRADHCINLCEIKFTTSEFALDKKYAAELDEKIAVFRSQTNTKKTIFLTLITTYGVKQNIYYTGRVVSEVRMPDLFTSGTR